MKNLKVVALLARWQEKWMENITPKSDNSLAVYCLVPVKYKSI